MARFLSLATFGFIVALSGCKNDEVRIYESTNSSDAQRVGNLAAAFLIENGYGVPVKFVSGPEENATKALESGEADVFLDCPAANASAFLTFNELVQGDDTHVKIARKDFRDRHAKVAEFLEKMKLNKTRLKDTLNWHKDNKENWNYTLVRFILMNKSQWQTWLPESAHGSVTNRLTSEKERFELEGVKF